jgi:hypothetical protein
MGEAGGSIVYNGALIDFARHYGFQPKACSPYRAKTKGKVERPYRAASPRRRSSNANSLGGANLCDLQRDILRRHFRVRVLHAQAGSPVSWGFVRLAKIRIRAFREGLSEAGYRTPM